MGRAQEAKRTADLEERLSRATSKIDEVSRNEPSPKPSTVGSFEPTSTTRWSAKMAKTRCGSTTLQYTVTSSPTETSSSAAQEGRTLPPRPDPMRAPHSFLGVAPRCKWEFCLFLESVSKPRSHEYARLYGLIARCNGSSSGKAFVFSRLIRTPREITVHSRLPDSSARDSNCGRAERCWRVVCTKYVVFFWRRWLRPRLPTRTRGRQCGKS